MKKKKKIKNLKAEIADAHAFAFNMLPMRTLDDQRDTLDEQLQILNETIERMTEALCRIWTGLSPDPATEARCALQGKMGERAKFNYAEAAGYIREQMYLRQQHGEQPKSDEQFGG